MGYGMTYTETLDLAQQDRSNRTEMFVAKVRRELTESQSIYQNRTAGTRRFDWPGTRYLLYSGFGEIYAENVSDLLAALKRIMDFSNPGLAKAVSDCSSPLVKIIETLKVSEGSLTL